MVINKRAGEEGGERGGTQGWEGPGEVGGGKRQMDVSSLGGKAHTMCLPFPAESLVHTFGPTAQGPTGLQSPFGLVHSQTCMGLFLAEISASL